jgi:NTE family protein
MEEHPARVAMVFAGGLGLAAYHAGVYQAFSNSHYRCTRWQGCPPERSRRLSSPAMAAIAGERLRVFWKSPFLRECEENALTSCLRLIGAIKTRPTGSHGHFRPRLPSVNPFGFHSLYDMNPFGSAFRSWSTSADLTVVTFTFAL